MSLLSSFILSVLFILFFSFSHFSFFFILLSSFIQSICISFFSLSPLSIFLYPSFSHSFPYSLHVLYQSFSFFLLYFVYFLYPPLFLIHFVYSSILLSHLSFFILSLSIHLSHFYLSIFLRRIPFINLPELLCRVSILVHRSTDVRHVSTSSSGAPGHLQARVDHAPRVPHQVHHADVQGGVLWAWSG